MKCSRAIALTLLVAASQAWAVNKCTSPDGKVSYQEASCPAGTKDANPPKPAEQAQQSVMSAEDAARALNAQMDSPRARQQIQSSIERRRAAERAAVASTDQSSDERHQRARICKGSYEQEPFVGMTEIVALNCLRAGEPTLTQETETVTGISRTYAYARSANGLLLHLIVRNGVVLLVQR